MRITYPVLSMTCVARQPHEAIILTTRQGAVWSSLHPPIKCGVSHCEKDNMEWVDYQPQQFNTGFYKCLLLYPTTHLSRILNFNKKKLFLKKKKKGKYHIFYQIDEILKRKYYQNKYKSHNVLNEYTEKGQLYEYLELQHYNFPQLTEAEG